MSGRSEEQVEKIFKGLASLPSLPKAVERLMELSAADATPREFAELIQADHGLTAKVLKLVNSAFFGLPEPISALHHAAALLGTKTLKSLVMSVSIMKLFKSGCPGFDPAQYWRHSVAVAVAAHRIGLDHRPGLEDHLYVAGLLHDTGTAVLAEHMANDYSAALQRHRESQRPLLEIEQEFFHSTHAEVGHRLVKRWQLPEEVSEAIRCHELGDAELYVETEREDVRQIVEILRLAETIARIKGLGFLDFEVPTPEANELVLPSFIDSTPAKILESVSVIDAEVARVELLLGEQNPES
ncbi:MAG: HDOD domain-containing protein [Planctomycetota bacterium]